MKSKRLIVVTSVDHSLATLRHRRHVLGLLTLPLIVACNSGIRFRPMDPMSKAAPFVRKEMIWSAANYLEFIAALPPSGLLSLKKSLELLSLDATEAALKGPQGDVLEITTFLCQKASWFRVCRNPADFDYHAMVVGVAEDVGIEPAKFKWTSTFDVEHLVMIKVVSEVEANFIANWNKLSPEDRKKILDKVDPNGKLKDHAAIAAESGAFVIRALAAVVSLSGFSAYVAATTALASAAAALGVTLPFAAYTSVTAAISILTGPIGRAAAGAASIFALAIAGRPDSKKMVSFLLTMHALKLDAIKAAES